MLGGDLNFSFVDIDGNSLRFDGFRHEFPAATDHHDADWLHCKIAMNARISVSVNGFLLTEELIGLAKTMKAALSEPPSENSIEFESLEPYVNLAFSRDSQHLNVLTRLDLCPALGPVVEFCFVCRSSEIKNTLRSLEKVAAAFPIRGSR